MFQTHCYDAWLDAPSRKTAFFHWTRLGGTLPAPLFLFLAGIAVVLVIDRGLQKNLPVRILARQVTRRGAEIFALGLLFRLQEFLLGQPNAPWTDLLRVDVLNIIGLSLMLLGGLYALAARFLRGDSGADAFRRRLYLRAGVASALLAAVIAASTPPVWTTVRPAWLPWFVESYINGVHIFGVPQVYLFPIFPWAAFAFAGVSAGAFLVSRWAKQRSGAAVALIAAGGAVLLALGFWLDSRPQLYAVYDFWHSSPNFLMIRLGLVTALLLLGYVWCRRRPAWFHFSPALELGKQSLLVYWVSVELAYGGLSIMKKGSQSIAAATAGVIVVTLAMIALAAFRNRTKGKPIRQWVRWRSAAPASA